MKAHRVKTFEQGSVSKSKSRVGGRIFAAYKPGLYVAFGRNAVADDEVGLRMIAVAFVFENVLGNDSVPVPDAERVLRELEHLAIPHAVLATGGEDIRRSKAEAIGFTGPVIAAGAGETWLSDIQFELSTVLALPLERIYFVGTDPRRHIEPAVRAGMQAVWLRNGPAYPDELSAPAFAIGALSELLDVLREPYTRSLLGLRYILHNVAGWRPGRFLPGSEYGLGKPRT